MKVIAASDRAFKAAVKKIVGRSNLQNGKVEGSVKTILKAVERGGDAAVSRYTRKFDRVALKPANFRVNPEQVREAYYKIRKQDGDALRYAAHRITSFLEREKPRTRTWMYQDGTITLGQAILPLDAVGLYVPGGKAVYPSSVLMSALPAKVAGVKRIVMCTPATKGDLSPYLLVAADIAGVDEVYRVGGVQAIAAMA
jgi:histidinol dehydrogenase